MEAFDEKGNAHQHKETPMRMKKIRVTITIGLASKESSQSLDKWIQSADNRLYVGKNSGKNTVIS